jgi:hypothetical protein
MRFSDFRGYTLAVLVGLTGVMQVGCGGPEVSTEPQQNVAPEEIGEVQGAVVTNPARKVCWSPLQLRTAPGGNSISQTYRGRTFNIDATYQASSGAWWVHTASVMTCNGYYAYDVWTQLDGLTNASGYCGDGSVPSFTGCF